MRASIGPDYRLGKRLSTRSTSHRKATKIGATDTRRHCGTHEYRSDRQAGGSGGGQPQHRTVIALAFAEAGAGVSISGFRASARTPPYGAVKAAILEYIQTTAAQFARKGIRVNCIAPGSIEFPGGTWERAKNSNPNLYAAILRSIPFGRLGQPEEVARVAFFLASPLAGWITGQNIAVEAGQML